MIWKTLFIVAVFTVATFTVTETIGIGGYSDAKITDQVVSDALQFAVVKHNEGTNDLFLRQVARVISAQKQVVSGINYKFVVQMGKTACRKTGVETECPIHEDQLSAQPYQCTFVVYRHWSGRSHLTSQNCPLV